MTFRIIVLATGFLIVGCGSTPKMGNVIPNEGGIYQVITSAEDNESALQSALYSAETTCKNRTMRHVVLAQEVKYKGMVSESANQTINKTREIVAFTGLWIPGLTQETDYQITMRFKCEN